MPRVNKGREQTFSATRIPWSPPKFFCHFCGMENLGVICIVWKIKEIACFLLSCAWHKKSGLFRSPSCRFSFMYQLLRIGSSGGDLTARISFIYPMSYTLPSASDTPKDTPLMLWLGTNACGYQRTNCPHYNLICAAHQDAPNPTYHKRVPFPNIRARGTARHP